MIVETTTTDNIWRARYREETVISGGSFAEFMSRVLAWVQVYGIDMKEVTIWGPKAE